MEEGEGRKGDEEGEEEGDGNGRGERRRRRMSRGGKGEGEEPLLVPGITCCSVVPLLVHSQYSQVASCIVTSARLTRK